MIPKVERRKANLNKEKRIAQIIHLIKVKSKKRKELWQLWVYSYDTWRNNTKLREIKRMRDSGYLYNNLRALYNNSINESLELEYKITKYEARIIPFRSKKYLESLQQKLKLNKDYTQDLVSLVANKGFILF